MHVMTVAPACRQGRLFIPHARQAAQWRYPICMKRAASLKGDVCELAGSEEPLLASPPQTDAQSVAVESMLPAPPNLGGKKPRTSWNATALAFMGDAVWEVGCLTS